MLTTIDHGGRVVIPKTLRDELGLRPGGAVSVELRDGRIEIEAAPMAVTLERRDGVLVAVPTEPVPPLTTEEVIRTIDQLRR